MPVLMTVTSSSDFSPPSFRRFFRPESGLAIDAPVGWRLPGAAGVPRGVDPARRHHFRPDHDGAR